MIQNKFSLILIGALASALVCATLFVVWNTSSMTKVHTLKAPLLLSSPEQSKNMHLIPKGTTLYFDKSFPEGLSRYKVYINIDRMPLALKELSDPTEINPIDAAAPSQSDVRKLLLDYPITKDDLSAILKSGQLTKDEIRQLLVEFSK